MKILLVNDYGTPEGGAEIQTNRLRRILIEKGHDARLFSSNVKNGDLINEADYKCFGTASPFRTLVQSLNPGAFFKLRTVLREFNPDVVHVKIFLTQLSPLILPLLKNIPTLYHVAWYRPVCPTGTKLLPDGTVCTERAGIPCYRNQCLPLRDWLPLMLQLGLFRRWRSSLDSVMANSESVKKILESNGLTPVEVLHYGIAEKSENSSLSDTPTVAFAGRLVREKGVDVLLRAFANVINEIPAARLLIAGDGTDAKRTKDIIDDLKISSNVSMLGRVPASEIDEHLSRAWVQVVPSLWEEPFGIVAIEAMMRGTAVIASSSGGPREIIDNGKTGLLVRPGDVGALTGSLIEVLRNRELAKSLGKAGRNIARSRFREEMFLDRLLDIYGSLIRSPQDTKSGINA